MAASSVSGSLSRIFTEMAYETLVQNSSAPTALSDHDPKTNESKRLKRSPPDVLLRPETVHLLAEFLDPLDLLAWSGCCRFTREKISFAVRLTAFFSFFRIHKTDADALHATQSSWRYVYKLLIQAFKALRDAYGPYHVHPLHAAAAGETLIKALVHRARGARGQLQSVIDASSNIAELEVDLDHVVIGAHSDYFITDGDGYGDAEQWVKCSKLLPEGPAKLMAEAGRVPLIPFFKREEEESTDQFGLYFPIARHSDNTYSTPKQMRVFALNYQEIEELEDEERMAEWYSEISEYCSHEDDCRSIQQAFCQLVPLRFADERPWDDWTQLLRAGWLRAHGLSPFERSTEGEERWERVIRSLPEEVRSELSSKLGAEEERDCDEVDVLNFSHFISRDARSMNEAKSLAMTYLRLDHTFAKGSDYV